MLIEKRFLKYVSFDTQSDESSTTSPSTEKQFDLADFLSEEMQILGVDEVERTDQGIVYGKIYSNTDEPMKAIGFIAHMDTSPNASGHDIHPRIIRSYPGGRIILNEEKKMYLDPETNPELKGLVGDDLITTDGTTLLGADDKAGVAIIMSMVEYICQNRDFKHGDIMSTCIWRSIHMGNKSNCFHRLIRITINLSVYNSLICSFYFIYT